jgi:hypothetical protein
MAGPRTGHTTTTDTLSSSTRLPTTASPTIIPTSGPTITLITLSPTSSPTTGPTSAPNTRVPTSGPPPNANAPKANSPVKPQPAFIAAKTSVETSAESFSLLDHMASSRSVEGESA